MDASHQNERSMQWSGGHQESLVDQRLRVWRSVASFLWTLEGYVTKCPRIGRIFTLGYPSISSILWALVINM